ncbi:DUF4166 domain-containing protein [Microbacterium dextranolyticum]|uniref:DUF4166 domain-containing protein n=1 Tax=Microbacterium dextranolyticum TaxID=36806 RepID=A0A9W6M5F8_9MICO|nr:DUF4166 domain-containing protein [Microbacterium dextranolyticum]MBM7464312.1 hypothetical protein [Microbacterium dextranolyticum]GLJ95309.1 hypothetical protein GCM10017591_13710 [Microbacterium dextranolyticum]
MNTVPATSVYERTLGARLDELDARLRSYFRALPPGAVGVGRGTFEAVGPTSRLLRPVFAALVRPRILFAESGRDVPFTVRNAPQPDGSLTAWRDVHFPGGTRTMQDRMRAEGAALIDRIGRRGELEVTLDVAIIDGGLRLASRRLAWWIGGVRIPLPPLARVTVDERMRGPRQHVDARVHVALLGEVFRYSGSFTYEVAAR